MQVEIADLGWEEPAKGAGWEGQTVESLDKQIGPKERKKWATPPALEYIVYGCGLGKLWLDWRKQQRQKIIDNIDDGD